MNKVLKRICVVLTLVVMLVMPLSLIQASGSVAASAESLAEQMTKSFLTNVIQLDLAKYNVTLLYDRVTYPAEYGGIAEEEVRYKLETNGSGLDVTAVYRNSVLAFCLIYALERESPPLYTQSQPANLIDAAKGLLERYQTYTGSSHYKEMKDVLDTVGKVESTTVTLGNMKLKIYAEGPVASFQWIYTSNGLEKPGLEVVFGHGAVRTFNDQWNIFKVGSTTVKVSEEEAISIARDRAKNFSWKVGLDSNAQEIKDFTILESPVQAELSMQVRESLTLYPFWRVTLYLDKTYPGNIIGIAVGIWADTGGVRYIEALSHGGSLPSNDTSTATSTESTTTASSETDNNTAIYIIAAAISIPIAIAAVSALVIKKRSK